MERSLEGRPSASRSLFFYGIQKFSMEVQINKKSRIATHFSKIGITSWNAADQFLKK